MHSKVEAVACKTLKTNIVFIAALLVDVPKYIYGQPLYKEADACIAKWKQWHARLKNKYCIYSCFACWLSQIHLWPAPM